MGLPLPSSQCKEATANAAMRSAIAGIATCLPDSTDVQTVADSVTRCSTFYAVFIAWITVIWKAICYLMTQITSGSTDVQAQITTIEGEITTIEGDITTIDGGITTIQGDITTIDGEITAIQAQLPTPHTGTPTFTLNAAVAGTGATYTLVSGSTDLSGGVRIALGTAPSATGGIMGSLNFGTQFTNPVHPCFTAEPSSGAAVTVNVAQGNFGPITALTVTAVEPLGGLIATHIIKFYYNIGYTS